VGSGALVAVEVATSAGVAWGNGSVLTGSTGCVEVDAEGVGIDVVQATESPKTRIQTSLSVLIFILLFLIKFHRIASHQASD
jgi:uncharacterized protein (AIM24 family)